MNDAILRELVNQIAEDLESIGKEEKRQRLLGNEYASDYANGALKASIARHIRKVNAILDEGKNNE